MLLAFLGGVRDYHAMDWYHTSQDVLTHEKINFYTDLKGGEGFESYEKKDDSIVNLLILDQLLPNKPSKASDVYRNALKLALLPLQACILRLKTTKDTILFCHGVYYMALARLCGRQYIGTPQGSEILVRPKRSKAYKSFIRYALSAAKFITVDSINMKTGALALSPSLIVHVVQNGIDVDELKEYTCIQARDDSAILSIRALTQLYNIDKVFEARNRSQPHMPIRCAYPFHDHKYESVLRALSKPNDKFLGRLAKQEFYQTLSQHKTVLSIPSSDSSPRSVYEAIFLGCICLVAENDYISILPESMRNRIVICDLDDPEWLEKALRIVAGMGTEFHPCEESLTMFNQRCSIDRINKFLFDDL